MSGDLWTAWKPKTPESNKSVRPLLASTGLMRNTMSAYKPLALNNVSFCALNRALKR